LKFEEGFLEENLEQVGDEEPKYDDANEDRERPILEKTSAS